MATASEIKAGLVQTAPTSLATVTLAVLAVMALQLKTAQHVSKTLIKLLMEFASEKTTTQESTARYSWVDETRFAMRRMAVPALNLEIAISVSRMQVGGCKGFVYVMMAGRTLIVLNETINVMIIVPYVTMATVRCA
jgi:hypothetical protein